jgi:hypothetical protein
VNIAAVSYQDPSHPDTTWHTMWTFDMPAVPRIGDRIDVDDEGTELTVFNVTWTPLATDHVAIVGLE